ncbi:Gti1/Pac2 family-domain-containing protein [Butyriboletus roseoflavus]|nr:Gti1/Pac2 family-domain-containing protein [Butyriboletus roseoflavus]
MSQNSPSIPTPTSPPSWTEPPWSGWIETTGDALLILEAARRGLIPRVTRRLVDSERKMITSGSVFVFDEDESGIKRWTDGFFWSPSRILGNFLLYRETDKRGAGHRGVRADPPESVNEHSQYNVDGARLEGQSLSRPKGESGSLGIDRQRERVLVGSLTNSYRFKSDGLMKKTFSLTISGVSQHLISYYKIEDVEQGRLRSPSSLPELASLDISPEYLDKTHFRNPPKVEIGVDGIPRYRGEADDIDPSPSMLTGPLSSGLPLLTDGRVSDGKRGRYNPYAKKRRSKANHSESASPTDRQGNTLPSPATPTSSSQTGPPPTPHGYPDQSPVSSIPPHPHYAPYPLPPSYYGPPGYAVLPPLSHVGSPCSSVSPSTPHPHQSPAPPQPYGYSGYNNAPPADPQQQGLVPPNSQGFYPYYPPPPHPPYGGYTGTWHGYGSYPPQGPSPPSASAPSSATITELPEKPSEAPSAEPSSSSTTSA